jgi:HEAT repeat protein
MSHRDALIDRLKIDIGNGRAVTVAGTGVSVAACGNQEVDGCKVATWTGLLKHALKHCSAIGAIDPKVETLLEMQIELGEIDLLIGAAEMLSSRMQARSDGVYRGWLQESIGKLEMRDRKPLDALAAIPGVLATLNYDHLIEKATGRTAVTWLKTNDVQDVLTGTNRDAVLHLHGSYKDPESVVLGLRSYLLVKDHPHAQAVLNLFTIDRTLLFVGCGGTFEDPNFKRFIEWAAQALRDVAPRHYLLCRTSEIEAMRKQLADAPWLQMLDYGADYPELVPFLRGLVPADEVAGAVKVRVFERGVDLAAYQAATRKGYSRIKLEALDPTTHDVHPLRLTGMFIAQSARECAEFMPRVFELPKELQLALRESGQLEGAELDERTLDEHRRAYLEQAARPILEIVREPAFSRLMVLGDPGSGKSTLLQYLLLDWAEKPTSDLMREPLPLLIELREYAAKRYRGEVADFLDYLQTGAGVRWHFDRTQLDAWLKANPCLVMFDGLDEVFDPELRKEVSTAIHRFGDTYPQARLIVSSRVIGFQHQSWRDEQFRHVMLQELDEPQITDFLSRWHRHAYEEPAKGEAKRALLVRAIEDSASIRQLAGNPLLLTMMAILNRTQDLPRDRAELYEQCARLLLHQWKVEVAFAADPELVKASLDFKDKRGLLLRVARAMQSSDGGLAGNLITEEMLEATLAKGLSAVPNLRPDRAARALIAQLRGRNFMLCAVGGRSYAFVHRTFLEYFCAVEISDRFQTEQSLSIDQLKTEIFGHWNDETWHEVLCLLAGMLDPRFVRECLEWLIAQPDREERKHHIFLAARCVGEVRRRTELGFVVETVRHLTADLVEFDLPYFYYAWDEDAKIVNEIHSRAFRLVASVWRGERETRDWLTAWAHTHADDSGRRSAVEALAFRWKDDPEMFRTLKDYAQTDYDWVVRQSALEALARDWRDHPETLPIVKACALGDDEGDLRASAVEALARNWRDDPETLRIVKACALTGAGSMTSWGAMEELVRGWKNDPETLPWLIACAQSGSSGGVRKGAIEVLTRDWREHPETLAIVKTRAQADDDEDVRRSAVSALARGWMSDPETLPIVKARAQVDDDLSVRQTAVFALARGWTDDPETLAFLKARVQADSHQMVRESVVEALARSWKDDPGTLPWLIACAQADDDRDVRPTVMRMLAFWWKDDPVILGILKAHAQGDDDPAVRINALTALASHWKHDPEVLEIIKAGAQADRSWLVRLRAVEALARGWKADPETSRLVKTRTQVDANPNVRETALKELLRSWRHDPETLRIVKGRAQTDRNSLVRRSAVEALARGWRSDLPTLAIVKSCAQADDGPTIRRTAVEVLTRGWKADPETLPIIKACAQTDDNPWVREGAVEALARGWKDDAETFAIVQTRARADDDNAVRWRALEMLVRFWKDKPETLPILKASAQADVHQRVRESAAQALARCWKGDPEVQAILKDLDERRSME